jgi:uncharacterized membrane protein
MSYQERRSLVYLISTIVISVAYAAYVAQRFPDADPYSAEMFRFWGAFFLILIPVNIVARIVILIVFAILDTIATGKEEPATNVTDERDRLIDLKANQYTLWALAIGFMLAMIALVLEMPPSMMFVLLFIAGTIGEILSSISQFYYYRRGF